MRRDQAQARPYPYVTVLLSTRSDPTRGPQDHAVASHLGADVCTALATLTLGQQQILFLTPTAGYTERAIAAELAIPLGTVKARKGSALQASREALAHLATD